MNFYKKIDNNVHVADFEKTKLFHFLDTDTNTMDARYSELEWLAPQIKKIGFNLEFGVYSGRTISFLANERPDLKFFGFDSFEGLPEDWDMGGKFVKKEYFHRQNNFPNVPSNVILIKGFFDKTIPTWLKDLSKKELVQNDYKISYLHVDSDLYSSAIDILFGLNELIKPGTIIRFDEICCWRSVFNERGPKFGRAVYSTWEEHEFKALNEWIEIKKRKVVPICRNWFQSGTVKVTT